MANLNAREYLRRGVSGQAEYNSYELGTSRAQSNNAVLRGVKSGGTTQTDATTTIADSQVRI